MARRSGSSILLSNALISGAGPTARGEVGERVGMNVDVEGEVECQCANERVRASR